ncbi:hypothetical protein [Spirosoma fluminis]
MAANPDSPAKIRDVSNGMRKLAREMKTRTSASVGWQTVATYADALTAASGLKAKLITVLDDDSAGNAGAVEGGTNPTTMYLYVPTVGLRQLYLYKPA